MRPRGRRLGAWSIAAALLSVNAGCAGYRPPPPPFDPGDVSRPSAPMAFDSLSAYVAGADRRIVAVDLMSGRTRWS